MSPSPTHVPHQPHITRRPHCTHKPLISPSPVAPLQAWQPRAGTPPPDDWEIDISQLQIDAKVASGSFSNLYKGSYCGQEVAIKILKDVSVRGGTARHTWGMPVHCLCTARAQRVPVQFLAFWSSSSSSSSLITNSSASIPRPLLALSSPP